MDEGELRTLVAQDELGDPLPRPLRVLVLDHDRMPPGAEWLPLGPDEPQERRTHPAAAPPGLQECTAGEEP